MEKVNKVLVLSILVIAVAVMLAWKFSVIELLTVLPGGASMKFNTALGFALLALIQIYHYKRLNQVLSFIVFLIAVSALLGYLTDTEIFLDNLFHRDDISDSYPGRMSPGTAICFLMMALPNLVVVQEVRLKEKIAQFFFVGVGVIALASIISYLLLLQYEDRVFFIQTMAFHTSLFFLILSWVELTQMKETELSIILSSKLEGGFLVKRVIPILFFGPILLALILALLVDQNMIFLHSSQMFLSVSIIIFSMIAVVDVGLRVNRISVKKDELREELTQKVNLLNTYNMSLDQSFITVRFDRDGTILYVNDLLTRLSGFELKEAVGKTFNFLFLGNHELSVFLDIWSTIKTGNTWTGNLKIHMKNGYYYWQSTTIVPVGTSTEVKDQQYLMIGQNVTEQIKALEMVESDYFKTLKQKNEELEQFAYIASHNLQEPLNSVQSFLEIIKSEFEVRMDDEMGIFLSSIQETIGRMKNQINGLLDYSRLGLNSDLKMVDMNEMVREILFDLDEIITKTKAMIRVESLPIVDVYPLELRSLIQNLIINALKYRRDDTSPIIDVSVSASGDTYEFVFKDNGIGIHPRNHGKVFHIFYREHNDDRYPGLGLGLSLAKKITEMHFGDIWVTSELGRGCEFHFTIHKEIRSKNMKLI